MAAFAIRASSQAPSVDVRLKEIELDRVVIERRPGDRYAFVRLSGIMRPALPILNFSGVGVSDLLDYF
jgi:hypothetical protein